MKLDIAVLTNIALFNELILDVNIRGFFFDSHFSEARTQTKEKKKRQKTRGNKRNLTTLTKAGSLVP